MNSVQFQEKILDLQLNMFNFAMVLIADIDEAQELLQETTLKALDNQKRYIDNVNFKGWVLTIMRNIFVNDYRKIIRRQTVFDHTENLYHLNLPQNSGFDSPEGAFSIQEMNNAINSLSDELKMPFSMCLSGYKYCEIAEYLGIPIGTVKSRIYFARQELQTALEGMR